MSEIGGRKVLVDVAGLGFLSARFRNDGRVV